eukprot:7390780-Prymnesium_polylepis.1
MCIRDRSKVCASTKKPATPAKSSSDAKSHASASLRLQPKSIGPLPSRGSTATSSGRTHAPIPAGSIA